MATLEAGSPEARVVAFLEVLTSAILIVIYADVLSGGALRRRLESWWDSMNARLEEPGWTTGAEAVIAEAERITKEKAKEKPVE